jgi:hypothetical protein
MQRSEAALVKRRTQASVIFAEPDADIRERIRVAMFSPLTPGEGSFASGRAEAISLMAGCDTHGAFTIGAAVAGGRLATLESGKK